MSNYIFYKDFDYFGCDIKHVENKSVEELKEMCDKDEKCIGFNTLGYLKYFIGDISTFCKPSCFKIDDGLYINNNRYLKLKDDYDFYPGCDYIGYDIKCVGKKSINELKEICDNDINCIGFNTLGYLKYFIGDISSLDKPQCLNKNIDDGLYINKNKYLNLIKNKYTYYTFTHDPLIYFYGHQSEYGFFEDYVNSIFENHKNIKIFLYEKNEIDYIKILDNIEKNTNDTHIFIMNMPDFLLYKNKSLNNVYILNTEQLTRDTIKTNINNIIKKHNIKYIDYSIENIELYDDKNYVYYVPYQVNNLEIYNYDKTSNICIVGALSNYRLDVINKIQSLKIPIEHINGFAKERDEKLFKYKILVNVHYNKEYSIFETIRCFRCLINKMIIISEDSTNQHLLEYKDSIIFCKYEDIPNKVKEVYDNYDYYYNKLFNNFDVTQLNSQLKQHINNLINLNYIKTDISSTFNNIKTYVLNLKRRPDRRESFIKNNDNKLKNINYKFFDAVDGLNLKITPKLLKRYENNNFNYRKGVIGCSESHINMWIELSNSEYDAFLIFEDDVELLPNFTDKLCYILENNKDKDLDILNLGHHLLKQLNTKVEMTNNIAIIDKWTSKKPSMGGTFGYLITKKGAIKILKYIYITGINYAIDALLMKAADSINIYYCYPYIVTTDIVTFTNNVDSDIQRDIHSICPNMDFRLNFEINYWKDKKCDVVLKDNINHADLLNQVYIIKSNINNTILEIKDKLVKFYTLKDEYLIIVPDKFITDDILKDVVFDNKYL